MQLSITYADGSRMTDSLQVTKQLGQGKLSVYEVQSSVRQTSYALKIFPKTKFGITQYNKEKLMFSLKHKNIIQRIPINCQDERFYPLLTEFAQHGDFFDLVTKGYLTTDVIARTYFHQLVEGMEYIHSQGIAHLDLKLDNIMLAADFQLKIIDFDQAQPIKDTIITSGGTTNYRAPEVKDGSCSQMGAADIFSAGIILFTFIARQFPFTEKEDPTHTDVNCYSTFVHNNKGFWAGKIKQRGNKNVFTQDFMELINGMWDTNPATRFTLKQVKASKWFQGAVLDNDNLASQMAAIISMKNKK
jgi:serine/threonine protein kinase